MPLRELIQAMDPPPPAEVIDAANRLKYRDFLTVALMINQRDVFADNWIYIHDDSLKVGRIQNFKNWSPEMVPDPEQTCLGLEYFCFEGDQLWSATDSELVELATQELAATGLVRPEAVANGVVVRVPKAYPVYDHGYTQALDVVRACLERFENLQVIGRNGMHKYNNQGHSMLMAILAVRNLLGERHDLWQTNSDDEYQEEVRVRPPDIDSGVRAQLRQVESTQPRVPRSRVL